MFILDDARLSGVARRAAAAGFSFPSYLSRTRLVEGCSSCQSKSSQVVADPDYNGAKAAIASMQPERQRELLRLLGVPAARLIYRTGGQVHVKDIA